MEAERMSGRLRMVAGYQILGGVVGLVGALMGNSRFTPRPAVPEVAWSFVLRGSSLGLACLAVVSLIAGTLLWQRRRHGILLSALTQLVQLPMIMVQGLHFHFFLLLSVGLGLAPNRDLFLNYFYGSGGLFCLGACQDQFTGLNLMAGLVLTILAVSARQELAPVNRAGAVASQGPSPQVKPGVRVGVCKRGVAFFIDLTTATLVGLVVFALLGLLSPLDGEEAPVGLYLALVVFAVVFFAAPALFSNSLGKFMLKIRILGEGADHKPTARQCLLRGVLQGLWPVEALVILFSKTKRRLGDRLANTEVVVDERSRTPWYLRWALTAIAIGSLFFLSQRCLGVASRNTGLYQSAVTFLEQNVLGQPTFDSPQRLGYLPAEVLMEQDNGRVVVPIIWPDGREQYGVLALTRKEGRWRVQDWELRQHHAGFRYAYSY